MIDRAKKLAKIAHEHQAHFAMVGGAAYFIPILENELVGIGIKPLHSFTERKSVDKINDDGTIQKVSVFEHIGWVGL